MKLFAAISMLSKRLNAQTCNIKKMDDNLISILY